MPTNPSQATNSAAGSASSVVSPNTTPGGIVAVERVASATRKVSLTLTNVPVLWDDNGATGAGAYVKLFDFPEGLIDIHGAVMNLTNITATTQCLGASSSSVVASLGSAAADTTNFTLTSTEANVVPSTSMATLSSSISTGGSGVSSGHVNLDGTASKAALYLNLSANATDSVGDSDSTHLVTVSGTIDLVYEVIGDK